MCVSPCLNEYQLYIITIVGYYYATTNIKSKLFEIIEVQLETIKNVYNCLETMKMIQIYHNLPT